MGPALTIFVIMLPMSGKRWSTPGLKSSIDLQEKSCVALHCGARLTISNSVALRNLNVIKLTPYTIALASLAKSALDIIHEGPYYVSLEIIFYLSLF